jgi:protein phosphatase
VGDSRVYIVREGKVIQVTEDDSWVQGQIKMGRKLSEEEYLAKRNIILKALGSEEGEVYPQTGFERLQSGDKIVLTTDGVTDNLTDEQIEWIVGTAEKPGERLVEEAHDFGEVELALKEEGKPHDPRARFDDVTAVVAEVK